MNATPLRVALFTHSVNPRGGVMHTLELAQALHLSGHDVTIFAPAADGDVMFRESPCRVVLASVTEPETNTVGMVSARIQALKLAFAQTRQLHDSDTFDVLHAQDSISGNALAELKEEGAIHGFLRTVHHLDHFMDPKLAQWQTRAWRDADAVLCVSDMWTHHMRDVYGIDALPVINGVDVRRFSASAATPGESAALREKLGIVGAPVVLAVGGIEARKNTMMLLDAFARLRATHPHAQLVIAGGASLLDHDAYTREFFVRAAPLGLAIGAREPVVVTGPLDDALMPALFRCANAVAMVSLREGFGLVVLEALASRKPVVVSRIAPFTEYLDDTLCRWADPRDAASIAYALRDALDRPDATDFVHAVPVLLSRFSWRASARRHLDIYRHWLAKQPCNTTEDL
ncbi:glycosyl transferase family 1 [Burkholderia sp. SG-MS1]|uniref:MSMEG_0565 family glycosyltransferase n=1 Tax=Paraburkholderia sp. SG-MS1 TaxID=2023741 RepID=UPI0014488662|nr:MSMEG_0565 family glycosyltransferase [Paraburkholderia sp. SG-MS1]NKJ49245.1 glycosyl transferase family 1 [Paraburkholderia sp. SG-MS1]